MLGGTTNDVPKKGLFRDPSWTFKKAHMYALVMLCCILVVHFSVKHLWCYSLQVESRGGKCIPIVCDHSDDEQIKALFETIKAEQNGQLDILVNNAHSAVRVRIHIPSSSSSSSSSASSSLLSRFLSLPFFYLFFFLFYQRCNIFQLQYSQLLKC